VTLEINGDLYGVLNATALGVRGYSVDPSVKTFAEEIVDFKQGRRKKNWCKVEKYIY